MAPPKVNFNQQLASDAVDALNKLRSRIKSHQQAETPLRTKALKNWTGNDADQFRTSSTRGVPWITGQAQDLITSIGTTITAIQQGADAAKTQNSKSSH